MVTFDAGETLAERFRSHMGHSSSLYGYAMRGMADDWEAGGPTREACRGWEDSPNGTMVQLRFLAGVFRLVLAGAAPELVPYYPCLGGTLPPDGVWPVMRQVVGRHTEQVHEALAIVPQTNEPGRSTALLVGLFDAVEAWGLDRIRLIEVGASGGLNLHVDRFRYDGPGWSWGPPDSPLVLHTQAPGVTPRAFEIVERLGCDVAPVDAASHEERCICGPSSGRGNSSATSDSPARSRWRRHTRWWSNGQERGSSCSACSPIHLLTGC